MTEKTLLLDFFDEFQSFIFGSKRSDHHSVPVASGDTFQGRPKAELVAPV